MQDGPDQSPRRWGRPFEIIVLSAAVLLLCLGIAATWMSHQSDPRLIGTWQSDADRTIPLILGAPPYDEEGEKREKKLRAIYGKMRITYTPTTRTSDFDGNVETERYEVLGRDKISVVIRNHQSKPSPLDVLDLELSSFQIIRFEGTGFIRVQSEIGGSYEIFKRIKSP